MSSKDFPISSTEKAAVVLCLLGVLALGDYSMPAQVKDFIFNFNEAWSGGEMYYHVHVIRFLMLLPQVILSWVTGLSYDLAFYLSVPILLLGLFKYMRECAIHLLGQFEKYYALLWLTIGFLVIHANGRVLYAFIAVTLLLKVTYEMVEGRPIKYIDIIASLFLSSISSGVSIIVFTCFISNLLFIKPNDISFKKNNQKVKRCLYVFIPILAIWLIKNLLYFFEDTSFWEGVEKLLAHGVFKLSPTMIIVAFAAMLIAICLLLKHKSLVLNTLSLCPPLLRYTALIGFLFMAGGLFGILTMLSAIPVYLLGLMWVIDNSMRGKLKLS